MEINKNVLDVPKNGTKSKNYSSEHHKMPVVKSVSVLLIGVYFVKVFLQVFQLSSLE